MYPVWQVRRQSREHPFLKNVQGQEGKKSLRTFIPWAVGFLPFLSRKDFIQERALPALPADLPNQLKFNQVFFRIPLLIFFQFCPILTLF
jgi:hypothetical protein